jgi:hypothetical protein
MKLADGRGWRERWLAFRRVGIDRAASSGRTQRGRCRQYISDIFLQVFAYYAISAT